MHIDTGSFFILVVTLGAGGVAGYVASEKHVFFPPPPAAPPPAAPPPAAPPPPAVVAPAIVTTPPARPAPTCDDMVGSPAACPPPGWPAEEGGCGALPTRRCEDDKQTMKPRVAERAVACINALTPGQRCDPNRLLHCSHAALMAACSIVDDGPESPGAADAAPDELTTACTAIVHQCEGVTPGPTMRDCRTTLAGLSVLGRDRLTACMKTHCSDKGLLFCEAQTDVK